MRISSFIIGLTINITFTVQSANIENYTSQLPTGTNIALMVQKIGSQKPVIDYHSQQMSLPASTQKVITALAALLQLGPNFRFTTTIESKGNVKNGILKGDLVIRFGGDPTLKRQDLRDMVTILKKSGIQRIDGNLIIDTSIFASYDKAPGWSWDDMTQCFNALPSAAIIDRNCFSISLYSSKKPNGFAFIHIASSYPVKIFSQVRTLPKNSTAAQYCELNVIPGDSNHYTLTGCLTQRNDPLLMTFAIQDCTRYAGAILKNELKEVGITYTGLLLRQTKTNQPGNILAKKQSILLYDLLKIMLKKSDNMIADTIFRMIGHIHFRMPGTWRLGSDAIRQILYQKAGIDLGNTIYVDGSGLSRHNLISPATMMHVLQYIAQHDTHLNFISMLPLAGYDGSLQHREGLYLAGVNGKVSAKTGSLKGVHNLAGFITTISGYKMAFVQYLSGYAVEPINQKNRYIYLTRFESKLYRDIYQNN